MSMITYEPWSLLHQFHQKIDRLNLLDALYSKEDSDSSTPAVATQYWSPAVDIKEEGARYTIYVDLPGVNPTDIDITMEEEGILQIKGERYAKQHDEKADFRRTERVHGVFSRKFNLPNSTDANAIEAKTDKGVLTIVIPKQESVKPRKIAIKS